MLSWSWLLVALLGALLAEESNASFAGISGQLYQNVKVRPLDIKLLDKIEDDWYVVDADESEPRFFHNVQCLHYHFHVTEEPNVINVTKHVRYINQTRDQIEEQWVFQQKDNSVKAHYNLEEDPALTVIITLLEFNFNAPNDNDNCQIYYGSDNGYKVFLALSRQYCATQTPTVDAAVKQAKDRVGLQGEKNKNFYNEVCGVEDPIWTTTPSE